MFSKVKFERISRRAWNVYLEDKQMGVMSFTYNRWDDQGFYVENVMGKDMVVITYNHKDWCGKDNLYITLRRYLLLRKMRGLVRYMYKNFVGYPF